MIGFVRGVLFEKGDGYVTVDAGGIGYVIYVPANSGAYLLSEGDEVMLYTAMIVREDDMSLYGFSRKGELDAFRKLITVNGVGAKAGIAIMSAFTLEQLQQAIAFEDTKALTKANGIGKKTAERIVLELRDKFSAMVQDGDEGQQDYGNSAVSPAAGGREEALNALMALGYSRAEAAGAMSHIKEQGLTVEEYIKLALKKLF